jgi:3-methylcrotonyl-CoA carboxylase alpha subunit
VDIDTGFIPRHKNDFFPPSKPISDKYYAIAAVSAFVSEEKESTSKFDDPWNNLVNFRLNHHVSKTYSFTEKTQNEDESHHIKVSVEKKLDGTLKIFIDRENQHNHHAHHKKSEFHSVHATINQNGDLEVHFGPKREIYGIHRQGKSFDIFGNEDHLQISMKDFDLGSAETGSSGSLLAPVTGQVKKVNVKSGDHVKKGETLLVMSAMKMEFVIQAPYEGKVEKILCEEGSTVSESHQVVQISPS